MDATGVILRQPLRFSSSSYSAAAAVPSSSNESGTFSASFFVRRSRRRAIGGILSSRFCDQGHVKYYNSNFVPSSSSSVAAAGMMMMSAISGKKKEKTTVNDKQASKKKMMKKQLKLLKGLSRDLSTFSQIGFGLDSASGALIDQVKGNMISEATELLLKQIQKLKAEEKELKRKEQEEKARLKAARRQNSVFDCQMSSNSSSSSSSSSDSECGEEIVNMNNLKRRAHSKQTTTLQQPIDETTTTTTTTTTYPIAITPTITKPEPNCVENESLSSLVVVPSCTKKIEVCMGGKCKKSGAGALLDEFQKIVGIGGAVSGCKCMGKCRDGPNVKVSNEFEVFVDKSVETTPTRARAPANSLCLGVGLEDVDMIVANFLSENHNQVGFPAAAC